MFTMTEFENNGEARLLVVDDEPNIRDLLASSLRFAGFDVITASTQTSAHLHGIPSEQAAQLRDYLAQRGSAEMAGL